MKKETRIQLESELEKVQSDVSNTKLHIHMLNLEKQKSERNLSELVDRKNKIINLLKGA
ncbi:hypothetical protein J0835_28440 [Bacillus cereus group sp. Sample62]|uniref:hypothetical protein n=1 Tax=Bacillus cereus group TaxID=86661 RepID=UPI000796E4EC|nr:MULTISPECIES: hypothetical protein [Bacillus cereus group]KXY76060.1 peptidase M23 [Bacillus cereus]